MPSFFATLARVVGIVETDPEDEFGLDIDGFGDEDADATLTLLQIKGGVRIRPRLRGWDPDKDKWVLLERTIELPDGCILLRL